MTFYYGLIGLFWIIFVGVWFVTSFSVKKNKADSPSSGVGWRVFFAVVLYFFFRKQLYHFLAPADNLVQGNPTIHLVGVILCGLGIAFAIWARVYLGNNWGMPMSVKEHPVLVTKGPYRFVRHPIYTGLLVAMFGSVLASSVLWLALLVFCMYYFYNCALAEEYLLRKEFTERYDAYKKKTKMLVPWLL